MQEKITLQTAKALLQQNADKLERTPYGLYFLDLQKLPSHRDETLQVNRIHLWDPTIPSLGDGDWEGIHSHPQGYTATTLQGKMRYTFYEFEANPQGTWVNRQLKRLQLTHRYRTTNRTGEQHTVPPGTCHKVHTLEPSITYFTEPKYQAQQEIEGYCNTKAKPTKLPNKKPHPRAILEQYL